MTFWLFYSDDAVVDSYNYFQDGNVFSINPEFEVVV